MTASTVRRKRVWTVADFAEFLGIPPSTAKALLLRLDEELNGTLLIRSAGVNRRYQFFPALLAKAKPEIFERVESLEARVEQLADAQDALRTSQTMIAQQVGHNTRDIARLKARRLVA